MMSASPRLKTKLKQLLDLPSDFRFAFERSRHFAKLPENTLPDIQQSLTDFGIAVTHIENLGFEGTAALLAELRTLTPAIHELDPTETHGLTLPPYAAIMDPVTLARNHPQVPLWGLQAPLLDLMENYIGLPPICMGASLRRDLVSPDSSGTRRWHIDPNDRRYPKIILYINDVCQDSGPFQYIPRSFEKELAAFRGRKSVSQQEMAAQVAPEHWRSVCGKAGTVIFIDTANLFHRGAVPLKERYSLFFSYASKRPKRPELCNNAYQHDSMLELDQLPLTERQRRAMFF
ncbi:MAG: hypothetical protein V7711_01505 [Pseudomonadales bacterium]